MSEEMKLAAKFRQCAADPDYMAGDGFDWCQINANELITAADMIERLATPQPAEARGMVEGFAKALEMNDFDNVASALSQRMCCNGLDCGCMAASVGEYLAYELRAALSATLSPQAGGGEASTANLRNAIELLANTHMDMPLVAWSSMSGEMLAALDELDRRRASPPAPADNAGLVEALEWYAEQTRLCRLIHSEGDAGRNALAADGGKRANDALSALRANGAEREVYRHKKRGTLYTLIGVGRVQGTLSDEDPVVLYRGEDGGLWARHQAEFSDGRFERVQQEPHP